MLRFVCFALGFALLLLASRSALAQPKAVSDKQMGLWVEKVSQLKPEEQEAAFRAKMGELNPKLDTNTVKIVADKDGVVREVTIPTAYAEDIRPAAVFRELEKVDAGSVSGRVSRVADLSGLRGLTKLKELNLYYTSVADLSPQAKLPIEKLWLSNTPVKDIRALKELPLTDIELPVGVAAEQLIVLKDKPLRSFSTSGPGPDTAKQFNDIFGKAKLEAYQVARSNLDDLKPIAHMPLLKLSLGDAPKLKSLAPLKDCNTLQVVGFSRNAIVTDLTPLTGKPIGRLELWLCTGIKDITPVKQMPDLYHLNLHGTKVNDLTPVAGLKKLQGLWVGDLQLKSLKPIIGLPALTTLGAQNLAVADKDFAPITTLPALQVLLIDVNPTTTPLLKKIPTLQTVNNQPVAPPK